MSIISMLKYAPKRTIAVVAMIASAVIVPATLFAWGPERPTYDYIKGSPIVTFNSIDKNPNYGDERNFVTIKDAANQNAGGWVDDITVENGKEYYVRMYVHNNAAGGLSQIASNVTSKFNVPTYSAKTIQIDGYLESPDAKPVKIWDQAAFNSTKDFSVSYVAGSAMYTNNVFTGGKKLDDKLISTGVKLGYDKYDATTGFDGNIPGCYKYAGFVTFKVKATTIDYTVQKTVRVNGATDKTFKENVSVKPGDKVDYQIYFKNTGGTQLKDVVVKDILPAGMTYVAGSSKLYNSDGLKTIADGITAGGAVIGGYMPNGDAYLMFTATVPANDKLEKCGTNTLTNTAKVTTSNGSKEDTATVTVDKTCATQVAYTCNALGVTNLSKTSNRFTVDYTVTNAKFKNVSYVIRDAAGKSIDTKTSTDKTLEYSRDAVGKYSIQATITAVADGKEVTATSNGCTANFEVTSTPVNPPVTPTPTENLPYTGPGDDIAAFLGLGSLVTSLGYYLASRRGLLVR